MELDLAAISWEQRVWKAACQKPTLREFPDLVSSGEQNGPNVIPGL